MASLDEIEDVLVTFLNELDSELDDSHALEQLLDGGRGLTERDLGSEPEAWTEDVLIYPLIDAVGLSKTPGRPTSQRKTPDFKLAQEWDGDTIEIIGENKSPNKISQAEQELVDEYISRKSFPDYGIATDGLDWIVYRSERGGDFYEYDPVREVSLRAALREIARREGIISQQPLPENEIDLQAELEQFALTFLPKHLIPLLTRQAPAEFRDRRQKDVDDFYELFIELLFGESDEYDYDTCLRNDVIAPDGATQKDKDVFSVTLVNRLLFIRFLEERDVVPDGLLSDRVDEYNEELPRTLYDTTIKPLIYELFNKEREERTLTGGWYDDVPYLNGGLFRENVENEGGFNVANPSLIEIINKLIEGNHGLDFELDPAILGSVFEKTINHLSEEENRQKETGAYYTPNDVTRVVNFQTVDACVKDAIIEAFTDALSDNVAGEFQTSASDQDLTEILSRIEDGSGWFGSTEGLEAAQVAVLDLDIVDPACGSGHFLTAAMEELHQILQSIYRGLHGGEDPSNEAKFKQKRDLALHSIYGVDVDRVATEIAKLRVWLKMVEGNSWSESFGQLPNIDINIMAGNSIIGLPTIAANGTQTLDVYSDQIDELLTLREQYKVDDEGDKQDILDARNQLREDLNEVLINRLNTKASLTVRSAEEVDAFVDSVSPASVGQTIETVQIKHSEGESLTAKQRSLIENAGFDVYSKSARLNPSSRIEELRDQKLNNNISSRAEAGDAILEILQSVIREADLYISEIEREPVLSDFDQIDGAPFHWLSEFPEVRLDNGGLEYSMGFDIVVGNPPYGDILSDIEKLLIADYKTAGITDIAAQFVERELQLLRDGGYFGNIITLRIAYEKSEAPARELLLTQLEQTKMACFAHRPSRVFQNAHVKPAIVTGQQTGEGGQAVATSRYLRFSAENRNEVLSNIRYESTDGLVLGEKIGSGENYSIPKIGSVALRGILVKLKDSSDRVFRDVLSDSETDHLMWRRRGALYWINPLLVNLYEERGKETPTSMYRMYFSSDLKRRTAFIILQSSLYYTYWMVYKNGRNIDWWEIEPFPFPDDQTLADHEEEIRALSQRLWSAMETRFVGGARTVIEDASELKPIVDDIDDQIGPMFGLNEEEVSFLKQYDAEYGRADESPENKELTEAIQPLE